MEQHNPAAEAMAAPGPDRREQIVELSVFLFLIVPSLAMSFLDIRQTSLGFPMVASAVILRDLALGSLILFFLWRNREPVGRLGWTLRYLPREVALGLALAVPLILATVLMDRALQAAGFPGAAKPLPTYLLPAGPGQIALALILVLVVAVTEETIFRGYLILRLKTVTASSAAAVVFSSAIFSLGHGYEGAAGVLVVGVIGAVLALIYLWRGSLAAPIVMHLCLDFTALVLPAILDGRAQ
jgi:membrane protease YdiL (CAAX protease family)